MISPHLEFGAKDPAKTYLDRPAAFGIAEQGGLIAVVRVSKPGQAPWHDLPGGAVEPGETEEQAVVRELGEETGLIVTPSETLDRAAQYFVSAEARPYRNTGPLMIVTVTGADPALKIEDDHELVWLAPHEALRLLRHDSHAWAVTCWLRREPSVS
jgi:8-oxo-dGTP diphosphatase